MTNDIIVAIATASFSLATNRPPSEPDAHQLMGIGLLVARRDDDGWMFGLSAKASTCETSEKPLLEWGVKTLPKEGRIVGWRLDEDVIPALLSAAKDAEPELSRAFLERLHGLTKVPCDDLALEHGGAAAPALHDHLRAIGIGSGAIAANAEAAWTNRRTAPVLDQLRSNAVALMHLWLMKQPSSDDARTAMGRWLSDCRAAGELR